MRPPNHVQDKWARVFIGQMNMLLVMLSIYNDELMILTELGGSHFLITLKDETIMCFLLISRNLLLRIGGEVHAPSMHYLYHYKKWPIQFLPP